MTTNRRPLRRVLLAGAVLLSLTAVSCEPAALNRWLVDHGRPQLREPELSKVAAALTAVENEIARKASFVGRVESVDAARLGLSWRPGCPVAPSDLRILTLSYWGIDGAGHTGELIVHRSISLQMVVVFRELWNAKFPIHQMRTAEQFVDASDFRPDGSFIETDEPDHDDNTSAFFCRPATGATSWSQHSYGLAVDINPVENPYVKGGRMVPPNGLPGRDAARPGTITASSLPVAAMKRAGMVWGGTWKSLKDYMHFSRNGH
ncbi:MAG: M15 family metallopeptidase [Acidimicrobiales bacterium]